MTSPRGPRCSIARRARGLLATGLLLLAAGCASPNVVDPLRSLAFGEHHIRRIAVTVETSGKENRVRRLDVVRDLGEFLTGEKGYETLGVKELREAIEAHGLDGEKYENLFPLREHADVDLLLVVKVHSGTEREGEVVEGAVDLGLISTRTGRRWFFGSRAFRVGPESGGESTDPADRRTTGAARAARKLLAKLPKAR